MPTNTPLADQIVTVCFHPGEDADWFCASEKVDLLLHAAGTPARRYHVRHRKVIGWLTRFFDYYLVDSARTIGTITKAAGGRKARLDLNATATRAAHEATARWRAFNTHINATTIAARPWEDFLAQHNADPAKVSLGEARRRFEQQPRVLAMLAYTGAHVLDPYELAAYQTNEATYVGLHWRIAMVGDLLITADGKVIEPASDTIADRIRFGTEAIRYLRGLKRSARLCAVAIA